MGCTSSSGLQNREDFERKIKEVEKERDEFKKLLEDLRQKQEEQIKQIEEERKKLEEERKKFEEEKKKFEEQKGQKEQKISEDKKKEEEEKKKLEEIKKKEEENRKKEEENKKKEEENKKIEEKVKKDEKISKKILESNEPNPSKNCTFLTLHGSYLTQKQVALDRLNEIRLEACNEGVKDPATKKKLTKNDYRPFKWSSTLEKIARIRAMESILTMAHSRLNNKDIWSVKYDNEQSWGENLAWNFGNANSIDMINQWYDEKNDWVNNGPGVTGHYESIISTRYKYAAVGWFKGTSGKYAMCLAGQFSDHDNLKEGFLDEEIDIIQKIDVAKSKIKSYFLECPETLYVGRKEKVIPRVQIQASQLCPLWLTEDEEKNLKYTSSDKSIIQIDEKTGELKVLKKGKVTITCTKKDKSKFATKVINVVTEEELRNKKLNFSLFWRNDQTSGDSYSSSPPDDNPIGSNIVCWLYPDNQKEKIKNIVIEVSDENVLKAPSEPGDFNNFKVMGNGSVTITIYTKDNPFSKITKTLSI